MVLRAAGSEDRGRGEAEMTITATLRPESGGTRVTVAQDLSISGAAANFGRGMIADVTSVLMGSFAECVQANVEPAAGAARRRPCAPRPRPAGSPSAAGHRDGAEARVRPLLPPPYDRNHG